MPKINAETHENNISPNNNSYESITKKLVRDCLQNEKGKDAEVLSWEVKDFTSKGDGYTSIVTSVMVKYKKDGIQSVVSYVVKLNPQRPPSPMTETAKVMFPREKVILTDVIGAMSKQLERLNMGPIKTPRVFASTMESDKEAFVVEDLRTQGFQMYDRKKGQDLSHALLVMKELGRFHASSCLLKESIAPRTLLETFKELQEPWLEADNKFFKVFEKMIVAQTLGAIPYLNSMPKYKKCGKWLKANLHNLGQYLIDGFKPRSPFEVLSHGDCWTNNMLFKYDSKNVPVDVRLLDLQCSRLASPASDINYFAYTSLTRETLSKYFQKLLNTYYQTFSNILILSRIEVPFTFKEFEDEVERRKSLGLVIGLLAIPGIYFVDGEEMLDFGEMKEDNMEEIAEKQRKNFEKLAERDEQFKERFLSMFDEMLKSHLFS